ncbi:MAG: hypothetical protein NTX61_02180 [Bacteroidetes bacterium]|nr:hypothetical protein [Bacteroidota bacterium]
MRKIQLKIPDEVDLKDYDFSMIIASKLYEDGKFSSGQAAETQRRKEFNFNKLFLCAFAPLR